MDPRLVVLARNLVGYSLQVKPGDKVLIQVSGADTFPMVEALTEEVYRVGGLPFYRLDDPHVNRAYMLEVTEEQLRLEADWQVAQMEQMDCYVGIRNQTNALEDSDVPPDRLKAYMASVFRRVHRNIRIPRKRWVILRWPNPGFAQAAHLSTRAMEELYFAACTMDYAAMSLAMDPLVDLMRRTDRVQIVGPGTDLAFSIKGLTAIKCDGRNNLPDSIGANMPDGEVFTAPVRDSVNGVIAYNTPTLYHGCLVDGVRLEFRHGRIVNATCQSGDVARLNAILDTDEGARYVGEFALGVNPAVTRPMLSILFDEKIAGSLHFTPGNAYDECPNGNNSDIHWDMVLRQLPPHGGQILFDGRVVRQDGLFVLDELLALNP